MWNRRSSSIYVCVDYLAHTYAVSSKAHSLITVWSGKSVVRAQKIYLDAIPNPSKLIGSRYIMFLHTWGPKSGENDRRASNDDESTFYKVQDMLEISSKRTRATYGSCCQCSRRAVGRKSHHRRWGSIANQWWRSSR
jgi:hypothetical protein